MTFSSLTIPWLLDSKIATIRHWTLTRLLDLAEDHPDVLRARQDAQENGPIATILAGQSAAGSWSGERGYYNPKYKSSHWSMLLLAELSAHEAGRLGEMQRGSKFMLEATAEEIERIHSGNEWVIQCLWGNILRYTLQSGLHDDPRARAMIRYLADSALQGEWRCPHNGDQPCAWGAARTLWGLAVLRGGSAIPEVEQIIASAVHFLLEEHSLLAANHPTRSGKVSSLWFDLNFPLFYQADILFVLRVLAELGRLDHPGAGAALEWLARKQDADGRFSGSSPFRPRTYAAMGNPEETRRWVTLQAAGVLKQAGRLAS